MFYMKASILRNNQFAVKAVAPWKRWRTKTEIFFLRGLNGWIHFTAGIPAHGRGGMWAWQGLLSFKLTDVEHTTTTTCKFCCQVSISMRGKKTSLLLLSSIPTQFSAACGNAKHVQTSQRRCVNGSTLLLLLCRDENMQKCRLSGLQSVSCSFQVVLSSSDNKAQC